MKGIAARPGTAEPALLAVADPPAPQSDEVLCRTLQLGVCGTDREILLSQSPWVPAGDDYLILGHECLARIERLGANTHGLQVGDLVVPVVRRAFDKHVARPDMLPFGTFIERGIYHGHGFSTPWFLDRPEYLFRVSPTIESIAVFTEPLSVSEKGVQEALAVQRGRLGGAVWQSTPPRVLVSGLGPIGFAAVMSCRARGWPVAMYGRDPRDTFRARLAVEFGAQYVLADDLAEPPRDIESQGFDLILECTGSDEVMLRTANWLASCGVMVWLGSSRRPHARPLNVELLMRNAILRNHIHLGTVNAAPRDFQTALDILEQLWGSQRQALQSLITARVSPDDSLWHYGHRQPQGIKTVVMYE